MFSARRALGRLVCRRAMLPGCNENNVYEKNVARGSKNTKIKMNTDHSAHQNYLWSNFPKNEMKKERTKKNDSKFDKLDTILCIS